jgi:Maltooligosyl trehalose synthase
MSLKTWIGARWARMRARNIQRQGEHAEDARAYLFEKLLWKGRRTAFGREHHLDEVSTISEFRHAVPVREYEELRPWFERVVEGEKDVLWPGHPLYLAKTSGTTSGAKYIPLTRHQMQCQVRGARDALLLYINARNNPAFLDGKMLFLSGSPEVRNNEAGIPVGRLSGIANHFVPAYLQRNRLPSYQTNCLEDWDKKLDHIIQESRNEDLRLISGIPPWVQMFFERVEETTGQAPKNLWPNLQVFVEGGVDYAPYAPVLKKPWEAKWMCGKCTPPARVLLLCRTA